MEQDDGEKVFLYVYDLTQGIARLLSTSFSGNTVEAVWHTGIGLYGKEYFFGPCIQCVPIGSSPFGTPLETLELGTTHLPRDVFEEYLQGIASRYSIFTYSLLNRNCNSFTDETAKFLVGSGVPDHILKQADTAFATFPLGATFLPMLQQLEQSLRYDGASSPRASSPWPNPSAPVRSTPRSLVEMGSSSLPTPAPPRGTSIVPSAFPAASIQPEPPRGTDDNRRIPESG